MNQSIRWTDARSPEGDDVLEFRIQRDGKRDITGALWLPDTPPTGDTLFCFGHGGSGHRFQAPIPHMAKQFAASGYPSLAIDGPDHGLRQTGPGGRAGMFADLKRPEALQDMAEDWDIAIAAARQCEDVAAPKLAYFGLSMGAIYGIPMLAERSDVIVSTLGLWGDVPRLPHSQTILSAAEKLNHPVLFLMQLEDEIVDREGYLALFDRLGSADKRIHANPGLHPDIALDEITFASEFMLGHATGALGDRKIAALSE